ncbi:hypothetical protein J7L02_04300 [Candidatus Woesearchaeota archaeon]|nr:hypothetical protein [Candidatus Woesearchaeota archaeon]
MAKAKKSFVKMHEHHVVRKKLAIALLVLLFVFAAVFIIALKNFDNSSVIGLNVDIHLENLLVMLLSVLAMLKVLFEMHKL